MRTLANSGCSLSLSFLIYCSVNRGPDTGRSRLRSRLGAISYSTTQVPNKSEKPKPTTETVPRESIDPLLPLLPPTRRYGKRKDLLSRDSLVECASGLDGIECQADFWDTLGRTRNKLVSFSWTSFDEQALFLGYRKYLGRVYYDSFTLRCHPFRVGDFVWKMDDGEKGLFRIVSAFKATRSYMGFWDKKGKQEVIQKRGMCFS